MRNVIIALLLAVMLLAVGCSKEGVDGSQTTAGEDQEDLPLPPPPPPPPGPVAGEEGVSGDEVIDVDSVDEVIVQEDLDAAMDSVSLDDW